MGIVFFCVLTYLRKVIQILLMVTPVTPENMKSHLMFYLHLGVKLQISKTCIHFFIHHSFVSNGWGVLESPGGGFDRLAFVWCATLAVANFWISPNLACALRYTDEETGFHFSPICTREREMAKPLRIHDSRAILTCAFGTAWDFSPKLM